MTDPDPTKSPAAFDPAGRLRSRLYDDVYFSADGGLDESRAVFLAGCGVPEAWAGRRAFTVGEIGFGTGLNILALLQLWSATRAPGARLQVFSIEAHPLPAELAAEALAAWPELAAFAEPLLAAWPGRRAGFHRIDLSRFGAIVDVAVMEAEAALEAWDGRADAWFLDGFSPAVNPDAWREPVLRLVAERSAPGARAATYTVAGAVRRGLQAAGFALERRPGFGRKRERLEARLAGAPPAPGPTPRIAIIGAGIAGAALARAFADLGAAPMVIDAVGPGAGASGLPAALVTPRLDAGLGPAAALHAQALARAGQLYAATPGAITSRGVLQLETGERDAGRFAKIAASALFEPGDLAVLTAAETSARLGEPAPAGLLQQGALVVDPRAILAAWLPEIAAAAVADLELGADGWRLLEAGGAVIAVADIVCLAPGAGLAALWPPAPITPVRGQASLAPGAANLALAAAWGAYAAPTPAGLFFGATHDRGETANDHRAHDDHRNLEALRARLPALAARIDPAAVTGHVGVRATTPDRLPMAGAADAEGLFLLGGFGSRGFALAPLLAEHVAALALGRASPLPTGLARVVATERFRERAMRRGSLSAKPRPV